MFFCGSVNIMHKLQHNGNFWLNRCDFGESKLTVSDLDKIWTRPFLVFSFYIDAVVSVKKSLKPVILVTSTDHSVIKNSALPD